MESLPEKNASDFLISQKNFCVICGMPTVSQVFISLKKKFPCASCLKKPPPFAKHRAVFIFAGWIRDRIHDFKYKHEFWVRRDLSRFFAIWTQEFADTDMILPIPLFKKRLLQRGFNQSALLAKSWGKILKKKVFYRTLFRKKPTQTQTELGKEARSQNLRGAFFLKDQNAVKNKIVLLVDDVYTTGATLREASRALKKAGAQKVYAVTLAIVPKKY